MRRVTAGPRLARGLTAAGVEATIRLTGEVGSVLAELDWARHPLGPPSGWSRSLANAVQIVLGSKFSMWMAWGPDLTFFCNDAYRRDTLGTKFPWALGQPAHLVWEEIWADIGPRIERVIAAGEATWDERLQLFVERSGYVEESYHTFSYSALHDDDDQIAGMLCVVSEDTAQVISQRRMGTLRDLGADTTVMRDERDVFTAARRHLESNPYCLPFTITYLYDDHGAANLACATGLAPGHPAAPRTIAEGDDTVWPPIVGEESDLPVDLERRFPGLPAGAWSQPPQRAAVVALARPDGSRPYGFLVVGLNRYRPWDDGYRGFLHLIAGYLASRVSTARSYAAERRRAEALAELDEAKTTFFTNISHEFRTPLTLLLGPAEDALSDSEHALVGPQRDRVEVVQRNAVRLLQLVNALLDFSRLESGRADPTLEPVDLGRYTAELASMFEPAFCVSA